MFSIIVAIGENGEIGKGNKLLWNIPEDLKNFKEITMGKTVIMGRKTFESIGRALSGRENVV
ncbi:MAG: dihydrofolate reductase, partial [Leptotrichiaceae bacterium]|nr:dihydrofolate reductase [Leptotrichiaceae bacterium]